MLTILSANENLLERLELLIQNTPKNEENGRSAHQARTQLLEANQNGLPVQAPREGDECCTKWMVLMAKKGFDEHQITLQTLADIFRLSLAMNGTIHQNNNFDGGHQRGEGEVTMKILVVKKERAEDDEECLRSSMERIRREWNEEWGGMADKLRRFGESDARKEQLARTEKWMENRGQWACALAYFDDLNLMSTINKFFQFGNAGFEIQEQSEEEEETAKRHQFFTKPPALHWTNYPRDAEVQVTFKFTFPKGTVPEWLFREWIQMGKQLPGWDYEYEWTNGILLRADELIKITLTRSNGEPHVVELSGRIDTDEAAEEEEQEREERNQKEQENGLECPAALCPLQRVWPYLVRIFQQILNDVEERKTLPFYLSFVFIGDLFFQSPENAPKLSARSLDAIQTLSSIQRIKCVRFRADQDQIYALNLDQCFPNFRPTKMADFCADKFPLPSPKLSVGGGSSSSSPSEIPTAATSLGGSAIIVQPASGNEILQLPKEKMRIDRSPSCVPAFALENNNNIGGEGGKDPKVEGGEQQQSMPNVPSSSSLSSSPQPGQSSLHVERHLGGYKNRGRRVSFGVIHSIPSQDGASGRNSPGGHNSPSPLLMSISSNRFNVAASPEPDEEKQNGEEKKPEGESTVLVENIVEEMLQKAIDEVLVTE